MIRLLLPAAIAASLLALAVPRAAHAARGMEFALQDDPVFVYQHGMTRERALDRAKQLRATRIRVSILWARALTAGAKSRKVPAAGPRYDFSLIDALQVAAARRGIRLQLTLTGPAPAWATANHRVGVQAPDPTKFAAFARVVATHFAGRVDRYSIWNEPNLARWLAPGAGAPRLYRRLYRASYAAIKRADPHAKVLFGELAPCGGGGRISPLTFLRAAAPARAKLSADGLAQHPYQMSRAPTQLTCGPNDAPISRLHALTWTLDWLARIKALSTPKGKALDLYLTEFSYLTAGRRKQSPSTRAAWLRAAYIIARRNPRVREMLQYQLVDPPKRVPWHSAVLDRRGRDDGSFAGLARAAATLLH